MKIFIVYQEDYEGRLQIIGIYKDENKAETCKASEEFKQENEGHSQYDYWIDSETVLDI